MRHKLRSHLTFANVVSLMALFVALGGTGAYATHLVVNSSDVVDESLTGVDIKGKNGTSTTAAVNGTLTGADIAGQAANPSVGQPFVDGSLTTADTKNDTLTGADINESTLAIVPRADKVDGLDAAELDYRSTVADETFDPVLSIGGLVLKARCHAVGAGFTVAEMRASTLSNDADISVTAISPSEDGIPHGNRDGDFDVGDQLDALPGSGGFSIATLVYSANGGINVTVTLHASLLKESPGPTELSGCLLGGTALAALPAAL